MSDDTTTPTPRTDAVHLAALDLLDIRYDMMFVVAEKLETELIAMTEQRDEWKAKYIQQNKDLGCEMMDPNGTIWDHAKKVQLELTATRAELSETQKDYMCLAELLDGHDATECRMNLVRLKGQRDSLAEALERLEKTAGLPGLHDDPARIKARKALQYLTTTQPEPK